MEDRGFDRRVREEDFCDWLYPELSCAQEKRRDKAEITVKGQKQNDKRSATVTIPAWLLSFNCLLFIREKKPIASEVDESDERRVLN